MGDVVELVGELAGINYNRRRDVSPTFRRLNEAIREIQSATRLSHSDPPLRAPKLSNRILDFSSHAFINVHLAEEIFKILL